MRLRIYYLDSPKALMQERGKHPEHYRYWQAFVRPYTSIHRILPNLRAVLTDASAHPRQCPCARPLEPIADKGDRTAMACRLKRSNLLMLLHGCAATPSIQHGVDTRCTADIGLRLGDLAASATAFLASKLVVPTHACFFESRKPISNTPSKQLFSSCR